MKKKNTYKTNSPTHPAPSSHKPPKKTNKPEETKENGSNGTNYVRCPTAGRGISVDKCKECHISGNCPPYNEWQIEADEKEAF